ncbi:MAG: succinoglycan biosynthesis transport protein ExoP [Verrucomicrobiales bacterium]|jgi:succinoglycan biosynthesis transport protein ExoP
MAFGGNNSSGSEMVPTLDLLALVRPIVKRWVLVAVCVFLCLGATVLYLAKTTHFYRAMAVLEVSPLKKGVVKSEDHLAEESRSLESMNTLVARLTGPELLGRIADNFVLGSDPDLALTPPPGTENPRGQVTEILGNLIAADLERGTHLIHLTVDHPNPDRASRLTGLLIDEFQALSDEQRIGEAQAEKAKLEERAASMKTQLESTERQLQEAKKGLGIDFVAGKMETEDEGVNAIRKELYSVRSMRMQIEPKAQRLMDSIRESGLVSPEIAKTIPEISNRLDVGNLNQDLAGKEAAFQQLQNRYGPKHPEFIRTNNALKSMRERVDTLLTAAGEAVLIQYESAKTTEERLVTALRNEQSASISRREAAIPVVKLQQDAESQATIYQEVLAQLNELQMATQIQQKLIGVRSAPTVSTSTVKPKKKLILVAGAFLGLALGCGLALLLQLLDRTYETGGDVEEDLGIPTLGGIPKDKSAALTKGKGLPELVPNGKAAEAFRAIRTSMCMPERYGSEAKLILVTSPCSKEGKSTCTLDLGMTFARQGERTLVIEANFHQPVLKESIGDRASQFGLFELLAGQAELADCIAAEIAPNLSVMHAGKSDPSSSDFLSQQIVQTLLFEASTFFDRIIVDTPSLDHSSDALALLQHMNAAILVLRKGKTTRDDVQRALTRVRMAGPHLFIGTVVNFSKDTALKTSSREFENATGLVLPVAQSQLPQRQNAPTLAHQPDPAAATDDSPLYS